MRYPIGVISQTRALASIGPALAGSAADLLKIRRPDVNVALWRRDPPVPSIEALGKAVRGLELSTSVVVQPRRPVGLAALVEGISDGALRAALLADAAALLAVFHQVIEGPAVVRLETTRHDGCRKLHADAVPVRLITTYCGPATEWVAEADAVRHNLARADVGFEEANASVLRSPDALQHTHAGDVLMLKGDTWPGNGGRGAVHRSPPVSSGETRLVLKIDPESFWC